MLLIEDARCIRRCTSGASGVIVGGWGTREQRRRILPLDSAGRRELRVHERNWTRYVVRWRVSSAGVRSLTEDEGIFVCARQGRAPRGRRASSNPDDSVQLRQQGVRRRRPPRGEKKIARLAIRVFAARLRRSRGCAHGSRRGLSHGFDKMCGSAEAADVGRRRFRWFIVCAVTRDDSTHSDLLGRARYLVRPLPYACADRIVVMGETTSRSNRRPRRHSFHNY